MFVSISLAKIQSFAVACIFFPVVLVSNIS